LPPVNTVIGDTHADETLRWDVAGDLYFQIITLFYSEFISLNSGLIEESARKLAGRENRPRAGPLGRHFSVPSRPSFIAPAMAETSAQ
jgi:hypothetical protein